MVTNTPLLFAGTANPELATSTAHFLGFPLARAGIERLPDGELHAELLDDPQDRDVCILQSTSQPQDEHLFELLYLADAARRADARSITALVPYFGYARQDKRMVGRLESLAARLVADLMAASGIQRLIALDLHSDAIEGFFTMPVFRVSAVSMLAEAIRAEMPSNGVIVSPDLGAAKLAEAYARHLGLPVAVVHKTRTSPTAVAVSGVSGDVRGKTPIVIDDMISTGGTIEAALIAAAEAGADVNGSVVAATHGVFSGDCIERLARLNIKRLLVTDSLPVAANPGLRLEVVSVAPLLAQAVQRVSHTQAARERDVPNAISRSREESK